MQKQMKQNKNILNETTRISTQVRGAKKFTHSPKTVNISRYKTKCIMI
ncbi:hypothetical protein TEHIT2_03060 [Tetragenococcus halophilus]|nr:hypothetical protein TEHIT2_03060 [Tetragenococcus halophilus]